jgi:predicted transcriptional regulator
MAIRKVQVDLEDMLAKLFGSVSRARILSFLLANSGMNFYQREIMFETGLSLQAIQRELGNLVELGIVKKRETNARVYYEIDSASPFFAPVVKICELTKGDV